MNYFNVVQVALFCVAIALTANANGASCNPKTYNELVKCALDNSVTIELQKRQIETSNHLEGAARQLINPELGAESVQKNSKSETTASLMFTLETGGKRSGRISEATGTAAKAKAASGLSISQKKLELILNLYRLSQIKRELSIEEESVETFSKIVKQYEQRPALNPEQEVSLSVFRMAVSDHSLQLAKLRTEKERILQDLIVETGLKADLILSNLPNRKTDWPDITDSTSTDSSPQVQIARSELMAAHGAHERAKGESWPDVKIGPSVKVQNDGMEQETFFGAALSLPLPVLSQNGSGRAIGASRVSEAELEYSTAKTKASSERNQLSSSYREYIAGIKGALSTKEVEQKHLRLEKLFFKGVVSSSLVIEAHRQIFELEERRNESEAKALESLGSIYIIDNKFSEVIL